MGLLKWLVSTLFWNLITILIIWKMLLFVILVALNEDIDFSMNTELRKYLAIAIIIRLSYKSYKIFTNDGRPN